MRKNWSVLLILFMFIASCSDKNITKVKGPFDGNKYQTNNRYFRADGKGESTKEKVARKKANLEAKASLAGQVSTQIKEVSDDYFNETSKGDAYDEVEKLQTLTREVINTNLSELRLMDEVTYFNNETKRYTVHVAFEMKKKDFYKKLKKEAKERAKAEEGSDIQKIIDILEEQAEE